MKSPIYNAAFLVDTLVHLLLCNTVFEKRVKRAAFWSCFGVLFVMEYCTFTLIVWPDIWTKLPVVFLFKVLVICLYKGSFFYRVSMNVLYLTIMVTMDNLVYGTVVAVSGHSLPMLLSNQHLSDFYTVLSHSIQFAVCVLIAKLFAKYKKQFKLPLWEWISVLLVTAFCVVQLYILASSIQNGNTETSLFPTQALLLLMMNVAVLLLLDRLASKQRIEKDNLVLQEQMRYSRQNLQAAADAYARQRSLTHDFDNHLLAIVQLLESGQSPQALAYAQTVAANVSRADVAVSTNNPIADAVLNQKYRRAKELGVQMQFLVSDLSSFPLSTDEMVTILANLLDNALEACVRDISQQKKSIRVKLLMEPSLATLSVQNTSLPVTITHEGEIVTTKLKKSEHGYGLKTCRKILQQCGFEFAAQYKDGWFQFTAIKAL